MGTRHLWRDLERCAPTTRRTWRSLRDADLSTVHFRYWDSAALSLSLRRANCVRWAGRLTGPTARPTFLLPAASGRIPRSINIEPVGLLDARDLVGGPTMMNRILASLPVSSMGPKDQLLQVRDAVVGRSYSRRHWRLEIVFLRAHAEQPPEHSERSVLLTLNPARTPPLIVRPMSGHGERWARVHVVNASEQTERSGDLILAKGVGRPAGYRHIFSTAALQWRRVVQV